MPAADTPYQRQNENIQVKGWDFRSESRHLVAGLLHLPSAQVAHWYDPKNVSFLSLNASIKNRIHIWYHDPDPQVQDAFEHPVTEHVTPCYEDSSCIQTVPASAHLTERSKITEELQQKHFN